jgi:hypothetical protein
MKTIALFFNMVFLSLMILGSSAAQQEEQELKLSFSNPDKPGFIQLEIFQGDIDIEGYAGKEVILKTSPSGHESHEFVLPEIPQPFENKKDEEEISKEGLKKIKSSSFDVNVIEDENKIIIKSGSPMIHLKNYKIKVPYNCSFKISTINGNISVKDINGEIEINTVNGKVNLAKIEGSAVAATVNGTIKVGFKKVTPDAPMAFSTINSPIDVTLPSNTKATLKMKTDRGDIYSNFDIDIKKEDEEKWQKESGQDFTATGWTKWTIGKINGGGPELVFKSLHGDIHIRKGE